MDTIARQLKDIYQDARQMLQRKAFDEERRNSLLKGPWGALMFLFYYEKYIDTTVDNAPDCLQELYGQFSPGKSIDYSYCNGDTGPYWLLYHLHRHDFIEIDIEELLSDFITISIARSRLLMTANNFDFLHGSAGICNLLVHYTHRPDVRQHLEAFVQALMAASKETPEGRSLPVLISLDKDMPESVDAFSLAHGNCSLLILLSKIYGAGIATAMCRQLIEENITYTLHQKNKETGNTGHSLYPGILSSKIRYSRLSWCYGDMNVALALWQCGKLLHVAPWKQEALDIMHYNIQRDTYKTALISDNCICHGAAGIAAFYRRFWFETKEPAFLSCAEHWHRLTVANIHFSPKQHIHGIKVWLGEDKEWGYCWDLLNGSCGIGLSMISHLYPTPLPWDEFLLLS